MKPTKNKTYCKDCQRFKMLFETEKKANNFIKFNSNEIDAESGYSPCRSYYCMYCNGWHVTSSEKILNIKSRTERALEHYEKQKENVRKRRTELSMHLEKIDGQINLVEENKNNGCFNSCDKILKITFEHLAFVNRYPGKNKRKMNLLVKLNKLREELKDIKEV